MTGSTGSISLSLRSISWTDFESFWFLDNNPKSLAILPVCTSSGIDNSDLFFKILYTCLGFSAYFIFTKK